MNPLQGSSAEADLMSLARKKEKKKGSGKTFWLENSSVLYNGRIIRANYSPSLDRLSNGDKARNTACFICSRFTGSVDLSFGCFTSDGKLAEAAGKRGKMVEHPNPSRPGPSKFSGADETPCGMVFHHLVS